MDDENEDNDEIDYKEIKDKVKYVFNKLTVKDFVIFLLIAMMLLIYSIYIKDIETCNIHYQKLIENMTMLTTSLW